MTSEFEEHPELEEGAKPFLDHLEDLRTMLVRSVGVLFLGMIIAMPLVPTILDIIYIPWEKAGRIKEDLIILEVLSPIAIFMRVSFWTGITIAMPFIVFFIAQFVFPGLLDKERRVVRIAGFVSIFLFTAGILMGFFFTVPIAYQFMAKVSLWMGVATEKVVLMSYITVTLRLVLAFGLAFQLPIILFALGYLGLVHTRTLREKRRHIIIGILGISMVMTPADPMTMLMMAVPLYGLFEICILMIRAKEIRDERIAARDA